MRAVAAFPADRTVRLVDHPAPQIEAPADVIVQILDIGICGTDREIARFDYGSPPPGSPYLVIGHESLGQVIEVGSAVTTVAPGDLVVTTVRRPCPDPACRACAHGRQDFCFTGQFTERGIRGRHGFMTERIVEQERYLHRVPASLARVGVLVEPLTIAEKTLLQVWDIQSRLPWTADDAPRQGGGQRAVVIGAGPVGLLGTLALLQRGFETWVYSLEPAGSPKARWVESVGARYLSAGDHPVNSLGDAVGNIDVMYEATGAAQVSFHAIQELGTNGMFIFTGVPGRKGPIDIEADDIMRRMVLDNQLLFGTVNAGPEAFAAAITDLAAFYARWPAAVESLITARHRPEDFAEPLLSRPPGIKHVLHFKGPS